MPEPGCGRPVSALKFLVVLPPVDLSHHVCSEDAREHLASQSCVGIFQTELCLEGCAHPKSHYVVVRSSRAKQLAGSATSPEASAASRLTMSEDLQHVNAGQDPRAFRSKVVRRQLEGLGEHTRTGGGPPRGGGFG